MQGLEHNLLERCNMYLFCYEKLFQKILVELPKPPIPKKKHQSLLHAIGGGWYMNKFGENLPPLNKRKINKINNNKRRMK